jgi:hypothetical protein
MPKELYERIKVNPPRTKQVTHRPRIIDEQWMRLENAKNYSPEKSIRIELNNKRPQDLPIEKASKTQIPFRDRLVDFLMYEK